MPLSYADAVDLVKDAVNVLQKTDLFANANSPNLNGLTDAVLAENLGELTDAVSAALYEWRGRFSDLLSPESVQAFLLPSLREWALACGAPEGSTATFAQAMDRIRTYMVANSKSIDGRNFTYGTPTAGGGNTGNGNLRRLTVDEDGFRLEGGHAEDKTFRFDVDQAQTGKHKEQAAIEGEPAERDFVLVDGSGISGSVIRALTSEDSARLVTNPTFSQFVGTAPTASTPTSATAADSFTGWTLTTYAAARATIDHAYRDFPTVPTSQRIGVEFTADNTITQTFNTQRAQEWSRRTPYFVQVAIYRKSGATGTVTITFGSQSQNFTLGSLSNNAWNLCYLDLDKDLYHKNFTTNNMTLAVSVASLATGTMVIDDVIVAPMTFINGSWWALVGGSTPFKRGDTFTAADSVAGRGVLSYWLHHRSGYALAAPGFCLPVNVAGSETETDPT